jgi:hypothetical protein
MNARCGYVIAAHCLLRLGLNAWLPYLITQPLLSLFLALSAHPLSGYFPHHGLASILRAQAKLVRTTLRGVFELDGHYPIALGHRRVAQYQT